MRDTGITSKPVPDPTPFMNHLQSVGIPTEEVAIFKKKGMTDKMIDELRLRALAALPQGLPKSFEEAVLNILLVHSSNEDTEHCACAEP